jgi:hypothetical protein
VGDEAAPWRYGDTISFKNPRENVYEIASLRRVTNALLRSQSRFRKRLVYKKASLFVMVLNPEGMAGF